MESRADEALHRRMAWTGHACRAGHGRLCDYDRYAPLIAAAVVAASGDDVAVRILRQPVVFQWATVIGRTTVDGWPAFVRWAAIVRRDAGLAVRAGGCDVRTISR
jgi:hypothetical protein